MRLEERKLLRVVRMLYRNWWTWIVILLLASLYVYGSVTFFSAVPTLVMLGVPVFSVFLFVSAFFFPDSIAMCVAWVATFCLACGWYLNRYTKAPLAGEIAVAGGVLLMATWTFDAGLATIQAIRASRAEALSSLSKVTHSVVLFGSLLYGLALLTLGIGRLMHGFDNGDAISPFLAEVEGYSRTYLELRLILAIVGAVLLLIPALRRFEVPGYRPLAPNWSNEDLSKWNRVRLIDSLFAARLFADLFAWAGQALRQFGMRLRDELTIFGKTAIVLTIEVLAFMCGVLVIVAGHASVGLSAVSLAEYVQKIDLTNRLIIRLCVLSIVGWLAGCLFYGVAPMLFAMRTPAVRDIREWAEGVRSKQARVGYPIATALAYGFLFLTFAVLVVGVAGTFLQDPDVRLVSFTSLIILAAALFALIGMVANRLSKTKVRLIADDLHDA